MTPDSNKPSSVDPDLLRMITGVLVALIATVVCAVVAVELVLWWLRAPVGQP